LVLQDLLTILLECLKMQPSGCIFFFPEGDNMKLSNFNMIMPTETPDEYLLANMMSGAVIGIDEEVKEIIEKGDISCLDTSMINTLRDLKVILPDHIDEYRKFKAGYEFKKYTVNFPSFTLITTYACNLACPYCYQGKGEVFRGTMTEDTRRRTITFIKKKMEETRAQEFSVVLYGGEPLLNFDDSVYIMDSCFTWAEERGVTYATLMVTNGTLVTPQIAETLNHYNTKYVQITLDGPKRIHDTIRVYKKGGGTFEDMMRAAHILRDHDIGVSFRINVDTENRPYIGELLDELQERGLKDTEVRCGIVVESQQCHNYSKCLHDEETRKVLAEFREIVDEKGQATAVIRTHRPSHVFCGFLGEGTYLIDPYADVYKCLTFVGQKEHSIGHLNKDGEIEEHTWAYYNWMSRDPLAIKECRECIMLPSCGGGCAAIAYEKFGTYHARGCYEPQKEMKHQLRWYLERKLPQDFKDGKIIWD